MNRTVLVAVGAAVAVTVGLVALPIFPSSDETTSPSVALARIKALFERARRDPSFAKEKLAGELVALGPKAADQLEGLLHTDATYVHGPGLAKALGRLRGEKILPAFEQLAKSPTPAARRSAAVGMGAVATEAALDGLVRLLADETQVVSEAVLESLIELDRSAPELDVRGRLRAEALEGARPLNLHALEFFSRVEGDEASEIVERALGDAEPYVRAAAAEALGRRGDASVAARDRLVALMDDPADDVARAAVIALGRLREPAAVQELTRIRDGSDAVLRGHAADALRAIEDSR